ncbi:hypothetical protein AKO1_011882, partial [Acrasis kona]
MRFLVLLTICVAFVLSGPLISEQDLHDNCNTLHLTGNHPYCVIEEGDKTKLTINFVQKPEHDPCYEVTIVRVEHNNKSVSVRSTHSVLGFVELYRQMKHKVNLKVATTLVNRAKKVIGEGGRGKCIPAAQIRRKMA